jgi:sugar-specific transcriptional regulator TrmB
METTENQKIYEVLEGIGLRKNEIIIYLDLVRNKASSALEISKRTNIHRSNTYDTLRELIKRGFVQESVQDKKTLFQSINPEKIGDYIKQREIDFHAVLPFLKTINVDDNSPESIQIAHGTFALRAAALELLESKTDVLVYGASKDTVEAFGEGFLKELHKQRTRKKIFMRHIYSMNAIDRIKFLNKIKYTDAGFLPQKYDTTVCTTIYDDTVLFYIYTKPVTVLKIKNKAVAEAYRNYFELLWKSAKK